MAVSPLATNPGAALSASPGGNGSHYEAGCQNRHCRSKTSRTGAPASVSSPA
jgi:hypothetical protein